LENAWHYSTLVPDNSSVSVLPIDHQPVPVSEKVQSQDFLTLPRLHSIYEASPINTAVRCVAAILLTLFCLELCARFIVSIGSPRQGPNPAYDIKYGLARLPLEPGKKLILCVGGSYTKRALYPELIEKELKHAGADVDMRNLASVACSPQEQLSLLKAAVEKNGKPALVISDLRLLAFNKNYLAKTVDYERLVFEESYLGRRTTLGAAPDLRSHFVDFAERQSYLIGYRSYLRSLFLNWAMYLAQSEDVRTARASRLDLFEGYSTKGWSAGYQIGEFKALNPGQKQFEQDVVDIKGCLGPQPIVWSDEVTKPIRDYCRSQSIPLLFVWMPVHPKLEPIYLEAGAPFSKFAELFDGLRQYDNTFYVDLHDVDNDDLDFISIDHVNYRGAQVFSQRLAQELEQRPFVSLLKSQHQGKQVASRI
jgi:hypothetical protein